MTVDQVPRPATALRILIVDDNLGAAESLAVLLRLGGHETHTACDGVSAVESARTHQLDVVLLDIGLPGLDGYEAARQIRAQEGSGNLVIVALTGWGRSEDRRKSQAAGFDHHMVKPVDHASLLKILADTLARRS